MELDCVQSLGQSNFKKILIKVFEFVTTILTDSLTKCSFLVIFGLISLDFNALILDRKGRLNEAYLGFKLVYGLGIQGFLIWLRFIKELYSFLFLDMCGD